MATHVATCSDNYTFVPFVNDYANFTSRLLSALRSAPHARNDIFALRPVLSCVPEDDGMWLEFGVWTGRTMKLLAQARKKNHHATNRTVVGFDSFLGLPETWRPTHGHKNLAQYLNKGAFSLEGKPPFAETQTVKWQIGWFNETLPRFVAAHPPESNPLTLLHVDSDLYSSGHTVLTTLDPFLLPGVWIVFDELVNYPEYREGEMLALWQMLQRRQRVVAGLGVEAVAVATRQIATNPTKMLAREGALQAAAVRLAVR